MGDQDGFEVGIKIAILFIVVFFLLGLRAELCILLGAVGGLAAAQVTTFAKQDKPIEPTPTPDEPSTVGPFGQVSRQVGTRLFGGLRKTRLEERKPPGFFRRKPPRRL